MISNMDNGWQTSAGAWIADMGEQGDFGRRYVLDRIMLPRALAQRPRNALDVGCGEGRFCRMLRQHEIHAIGIDPTPALIAAARVRDEGGQYLEAQAECLPFNDRSFDLVVSYLSLIDIPDLAAAIGEMVRVLHPGGTLLIANLNGFNTACARAGGIDNYLEERAIRIQYRGIRVVNHHRPLRTYMRALLAAGLELRYFDEPEPGVDAPAEKATAYRRVPWFLVMEWMKPASQIRDALGQAATA